MNKTLIGLVPEDYFIPGGFNHKAFLQRGQLNCRDIIHDAYLSITPNCDVSAQIDVVRDMRSWLENEGVVDADFAVKALTDIMVWLKERLGDDAGAVSEVDKDYEFLDEIVLLICNPYVSCLVSIDTYSSLLLSTQLAEIKVVRKYQGELIETDWMGSLALSGNETNVAALIRKGYTPACATKSSRFKSLCESSPQIDTVSLLYRLGQYTAWLAGPLERQGFKAVDAKLADYCPNVPWSNEAQLYTSPDEDWYRAKFIREWLMVNSKDKVSNCNQPFNNARLQCLTFNDLALALEPAVKNYTHKHFSTLLKKVTSQEQLKSNMLKLDSGSDFITVATEDETQMFTFHIEDELSYRVFYLLFDALDEVNLQFKINKADDGSIITKNDFVKFRERETNKFLQLIPELSSIDLAE
jgi:hypothetical protein